MIVIQTPRINLGSFGLKKRAPKPPDKWDKWLTTLFPHLFYYPFVERHNEFWQHVESIQPGVKPPAFFAIWGRGGGKSTNAEAGAVYLGATGKRKFCLYTRSTQDKANESVMNIAAMLESKQVAKYYPKLSERKLGKFGNSKGWKVNMLRCANGFNIAALGYDAAVRGIKLEEYRPDVIFIDDIDDKGDDLNTVQKKTSTLTRDILPSGSSDVAVIGIQNLINYQGIFTQISKGQGDFLRNRIVSGPYPAILDLDYEEDDSGKWRITGGTPTWQGQDLATCEAQMNEWGLDSFISEAQLIINQKQGRVYHAFKGAGPDSSTLDLSSATGFWHAHDFGIVNQVWGLFAKIDGKYYLIYERKLPEGTTATKAASILSRLEGLKVVTGYGGAKSENRQRSEYLKEGITIRLPGISDIEAQINIVNRMFELDELIICSDCVYTVDMLENCIRDEKEGIMDKSRWHYLDMLRYFGAGIKRQGWARGA